MALRRTVRFVKKLPIPALVFGGMASSYSGDIPSVGPLMDWLAQLDYLAFTGPKQPTLFLIFTGLAIAWVGYSLAAIFLWRRKQNALMRLSSIWENGADFRNDMMSRRVLTDEDQAKLTKFENEMIRSVRIVSPPEVGFFTKINLYAENAHPREAQSVYRGGDKTVVIFSERLKRIGEFIDKHTGTN